MNAGVGKWTDDIYGFWVFWGSLGENMGGGEGPGQNRPLLSEIFTAEFTPNRLQKRV